MAELRLGMAAADITPAIGTPLGGYLGRPRFEAMGIHDSLYAKVAALQGDGGPVLLYSLDLLGLTEERTARIAEQVAKACGVAAGDTVVACTHTHSGPSVVPLRGIPAVDEGYFDYLATRMTEAGRAALQELRPASLLVGSVQSATGVNRRAATDGAISLGENPEGPYDDQLLVLRFLEAESERTLGVIVSYGCHLTSLGASPLISAEWAGLAMAALERDLGCTCMFLNGPIGNVSPRGRDSTWARTGQIADAFRADCRRALSEAAPEAGLPLATAQQPVELPLAPLAPQAEVAATLAEAEATLAARGEELSKRSARVQRDYALAAERCRREACQQERQAVTLTGVRIGPVAFLGMPGEVFAEYSLRLREEVPFRYSTVLSNVGAEVGYLPTRAAFEEGGYEPTSFVYFGVQGLDPTVEDVLFAGGRALANTLWNR